MDSGTCWRACCINAGALSGIGAGGGKYEGVVEPEVDELANNVTDVEVLVGVFTVVEVIAGHRQVLVDWLNAGNVPSSQS